MIELLSLFLIFDAMALSQIKLRLNAKQRLAALVGVSCLLFGARSFSQSFSEQEVVGTWKVNRVSNQMNSADIPPDRREMVAKVEKAFLESRFVFKPDHRSAFQFSFREMAIPNGYWKFNYRSGTITIQDWNQKDNGPLLMGLQVIENYGKVYFIVEKLPFTLEVEKI